jgi:hypothetical protein
MRCYNCNKKKAILLDCKYCYNGFCSSCIEIIKHSCPNIEDCRKRKRDELKKKLYSEKCVDSKVIKI